MVEQAIREALERGEFDDLPGQGKPLRWDTENDGPLWLAHHVLKNAGIAPDWVEEGKEIRAELESLAASLGHLEARWSSSPSASTDQSGLSGRQWLDFERSYRERAQRLNASIDRFNLKVPLMSPKVRRLNADAELEQLRARLAERLGRNDPDPDGAARP